MRRMLLVLLLLNLVAAESHLLAESPVEENTAERSLAKNVVLLLVDDLGAKDLGVTGSTFYKTPSIDQLATQSVHFQVAYAPASVCSPSRASLLTGLHPVDLNITDWIPGNSGNGRLLETPEDESHLGLEFTTIAELLQSKGYHTFYAGKWHLGGRGLSPIGGPGYTPPFQGFDEYFDPHFQPEKGQPPNVWVDGDRPHATRLMTDRTIEFIETQRDQPFFAMLSYYDVHTPIVADKTFLPGYQSEAKGLKSSEPIIEHSGKTRARQDSPAYASMVSAVDQSVGRIVESLKSSGKWEDTIVIFTSDNGGLSTLRQPGPTSNSPLRAGKGWLYEGGIRVPLLMRIPDIDHKTVTCPVSLYDLYPTIAKMCSDRDETNNKALAGVDLTECWKSSNTIPDRTFVWHYPHYHGSTWTPGAAIRKGDWKLIRFYEDESVELYNLGNDPHEENNLAESHVEEKNDLLSDLQKWQEDHHAKLPTRREGVK